MTHFLKYLVLFFIALLSFVRCDDMFDVKKVPESAGERDVTLAHLNVTTGGPYTYSQSKHHFYGTGYDGSYIDTYAACSGQSGSCRDNPSCQCEVAVGPLPQGTYTLGSMYTFKGMPYCYDLYPSSSNNMCGRSGFLIHGGSCSANPSEGCIVIESESTRYLIKSGATLKVTS